MNGKWVVGVDPGRVNLGLCFLDRFTHDAELYHIDHTIVFDFESGFTRKAEQEEKHVFSVVEKLVEDFAQYFKDAHIVVVEKQMRREHLIFAATLVAYLHGRYTTRVFNVSPVSVRAFFGIRDPDYNERKGLSLIAVEPFLSPRAFRDCLCEFAKPGDFQCHADAQEAMLLAVYALFDENGIVSRANAARKFVVWPRGAMVHSRSVRVHVDVSRGMAATEDRKRRPDPPPALPPAKISRFFSQLTRETDADTPRPSEEATRKM